MLPNSRFEFRLQHNVESAQSQLADFVEQKHREVAMIHANFWLADHPNLAAERFEDPLGKLKLRTPERVREQRINDRLSKVKFKASYFVGYYYREADKEWEDAFDCADDALRFCAQLDTDPDIHVFGIGYESAEDAERSYRRGLEYTILDPTP